VFIRGIDQDSAWYTSGFPKGLPSHQPYSVFNYFTSDFPYVSGSKSSFADDFTIGKYDPDPEGIATALNKDFVLVSKWAKCKSITISAEKSQVAFFTPWNREKTFLPIFYEGKL
jgi:hypothetical protein